MNTFTRLFAVLLCASVPVMSMAQKAEMPEPKDFLVGDSWEWRQFDNRTKQEEGKFNRSVIRVNGILRFQSETGRSFQISNAFLGHPGQTKPWRVWPLEVGKEWVYDEDWTESGVSGNTRQNAKVVAYEDVTVPAGKFMAFKIEYKGWYRNSRGSSGIQFDTYWYAPEAKADVKRLRDDGFNNWTRELVNYKRGTP
ncbi:MAG TPA: hypothetical protein VIW72_05505 [Burkholderiales bacterium]